MTTAADGRIFSGIKVLDFTQYLAGPTVTRFMAELGAEIIKVEIAPGGDPSRSCRSSATAAASTSCSRTAASGACASTCRSARPSTIVRGLGRQGRRRRRELRPGRARQARPRLRRSLRQAESRAHHGFHLRLRPHRSARRQGRLRSHGAGVLGHLPHDRRSGRAAAVRSRGNRRRRQRGSRLRRDLGGALPPPAHRAGPVDRHLDGRRALPHARSQRSGVREQRRRLRADARGIAASARRAVRHLSRAAGMDRDLGARSAMARHGRGARPPRARHRSALHDGGRSAARTARR